MGAMGADYNRFLCIFNLHIYKRGKGKKKEIEMNKENNMKCKKCKSQMVLRNGKFGQFWGCTKFPKCKGTQKYVSDTEAVNNNEPERDDFVSDEQEEVM
jgi:ssDNA-binding Zn-finger/Zn-ribbon topoisomerase 1